MTIQFSLGVRNDQMYKHVKNNNAVGRDQMNPTELKGHQQSIHKMCLWIWVLKILFGYVYVCGMYMYVYVGMCASDCGYDCVYGFG